MNKLLFALGFVIFLTGCDSQVSDKTDRALAQERVESELACARGECPCETPVGTIQHGSKLTTYSASEVECDQGCGAIAAEATCVNGELDQDVSERHFRCRVKECPNCFLGQNLILSGETVEVYSAETVGCRASCEDVKQRRTCIMGQLTGSDAYQFFQCERRPCRCELPANAGYLSLEGSVRLYSASNAACGNTCDGNHSQVRTCQSSVVGGETIFALNGDARFDKLNCQEATNCFCTLPGGLGVLAHGQTKKVFTQATVPCGESCQNIPSVDVRCDNGRFLNAANPSQTVDFSTPAFSSYAHECAEQQCVSCPVPGTTVSVMHGEKFRFAKKASAGCDEECEFLERTCQNGSFTGNAAFRAPECTKRHCKCVVPGENGLEVPVGSTRTFFSSLVAQCGQSCEEISEPKVCREVESNGTFSYQFQGSSSHSFASCNAPTGCACALPGSLGSIEAGKSVVLTSQEQIACGTRCADVPSVEARCDNGTLIDPRDMSTIPASSPGYEFRYFCQQAGCSACPLPGYGTIANGNQVTLYSKNQLGCGEKPESFTYTFRCENGALSRNNAPYVPSEDSSRPDTWYTDYQFNCPGCTLPWGGSVGEGSSVQAYKFSGTVVNGCGRGCKVAERRCEEGVLRGDNSFNMRECDNSCALDGGGAPPRLCLLRWQNSWVTPDTQVPMYSRRSVPCGDSCQNYFKLARCNMESGSFDAPLEFQYQSCKEDCP